MPTSEQEDSVDVKATGIEAQLGSKGIWLVIKTPDGATKVGELHIGMKWVEWWPKGFKKNHKKMELQHFITQHLDKMPAA